MKKLLVGLMVGAIMFAAIASVAQARGNGNGKGKGNVNTASTASITLDQADPHLGDTVTFSWSVDGTVQYPRIQVVCYQDGVMVYGEAGPADQSFTLGGGNSQWLMNGGAADCTATLYEWDFHPVQTFVPYAETTFAAGG